MTLFFPESLGAILTTLTKPATLSSTVIAAFSSPHSLAAWFPLSVWAQLSAD